MSWPGARRARVSACAILVAGIGSAAAQQSSNTYQATADLYRRSAERNAPDRRECFLGWAAHYDAMAEAARLGNALPPEPDLDPMCPSAGHEALVPNVPASPEPVETQAAPSDPAVSPEAEVPPEELAQDPAGSAESAEVSEPAESVSQPAPTLSAVAQMFDGLRYDMSKSVAPDALSPADRRKVDAIELILEDLSAAPPNGRGAYLEEFLSASAPLVTELTDHSYQFGILTLRAAAFLELDQVEGGRETARQLVGLNATASNGPSVRRLLAILERKGLFPEIAEASAAAAKTATIAPIAAPTNLAGSVWSGSLVVRSKSKDRKELANHRLDLQFGADGRGTAIYRHFTPSLTWTQVGKRVVVKMALNADCQLSLDASMEGVALQGEAIWAGDLEKNRQGSCFGAAGGAPGGSAAIFPTEFKAAFISASPENAVRPVRNTL